MTVELNFYEILATLFGIAMILLGLLKYVFHAVAKDKEIILEKLIQDREYNAKARETQKIDIERNARGIAENAAAIKAVSDLLNRTREESKSEAARQKANSAYLDEVKRQIENLFGKAGSLARDLNQVIGGLRAMGVLKENDKLKDHD